METGYPTSGWPYTRSEQERFINTALQIIKSKVSTQNLNNPDNRILLCCWYELYDANTGGGGDIEYHFGILETGGAKKEAYDDLQKRIGEFYGVVG